MKEKIKEILRAVPIAGKTYPEYIEALADELIAEGVGLWKEENKIIKAKIYSDRNNDVFCFSCGFPLHRQRSEGNYCSSCGAALDWEGERETEREGAENGGI